MDDTASFPRQMVARLEAALLELVSERARTVSVEGVTYTLADESKLHALRDKYRLEIAAASPRNRTIRASFTR